MGNRKAPDFRARSFFKIMRLEVALVLFSVGAAFYMPTVLRKRNEQRAGGPQNQQPFAFPDSKPTAHLKG